jgi:O-antigen biosynthesis protein
MSVEKERIKGYMLSHFFSGVRSRLFSQKTPKTPSLALPLSRELNLQPAALKVAVILHLYYVDLATEIAEYLSNIPVPFDLFISTDTREKVAAIRQHPLSRTARDIELRIVPNRGRDMAPKLITFADVFANYDVALFIHAKRSLHHSELAGWRTVILSQLVGTETIVNNILGLFSAFPDLGIIAPKHFEPIFSNIRWGINWQGAKLLADRLDVKVNKNVPIDFPSGSMFWARPAALAPLVDLKLGYEDFETERGQEDGALGHQLERLVYFSCEKAGYRWLKIAKPELFKEKSKIIHASDKQDCERLIQSNLLQSHGR